MVFNLTKYFIVFDVILGIEALVSNVEAIKKWQCNNFAIVGLVWYNVLHYYCLFVFWYVSVVSYIICMHSICSIHSH